MRKNQNSDRFDKYRQKAADQTQDQVPDHAKNHTKDSKNKKLRMIVIAIFLIFVLAEGKQFLENKKLSREHTKLEAQLEEAKNEQKQLEEEKENLTTREYIEKIAREKLGLFYPNEYVLEEDKK